MRVEVMTFKEGLLSRVAHDLKLRTEARVDDGVAVIDASALRVVCAMKKGKEAPRTLSDKDRRSIEQSMRDDVLHTKRFPEIRFEADEDAGDRVTGTLSLHGVSKPVTLRFRSGVARIQLDQRDFGITPFTAMMGALKVQPTIEVVIYRS